MNVRRAVEILKAERKRLGLSMRDVLERGGPSINTISRAENGVGEPRYDALARWADALEMDCGIRLAPRITTPIALDENDGVLQRIRDGLRSV